MNFADFTSFFMTLVAISLAPGPVVLMLMVRAAGNDTRGALSFGVGYALGGLAIIAAVCFGLGVWLTAVPEVFEYSKYAMMAYILWLARGIWKGGFDMTGDCTPRKAGMVSAMVGGAFTCFISPYMMILFPLVLPEMMDITTIQMPDFLIIAMATFAALYAGSLIIILFAAQLRKLVRSPQHAAIVNRVLSSLLVVGGSWMAFS